MWERFDSGFYITLAQYGYWPTSTLHTYSNWAFYPLFPMLIFLFAYLFGGSQTAFTLAGLLVSNTAAVIAIIYLYKLVRDEFGTNVASLSVLYLALFPTAFLSLSHLHRIAPACLLSDLYLLRSQTPLVAGQPVWRIGSACTSTRCSFAITSSVGVLASYE